ncbi:MAG: RlmE family RNA methyltransferase [Pseudomonadota bacterium]|nr:RlmE family RNA methyltransferase [Pseudomonadota bacterium]
MANSTKGAGGGKDKGLGGVASRRRPAVRVKAKRQRSASSRQWLQRHLNDPYVAAAKDEGYRSRAAFKLLQLDEQFHFLRGGLRVVDLGAAPGGWSQVTASKIGGKGKLVALDILPMDPIAGVDFIQMDFLADDAPNKLKAMLKGQANLVLSDLAPSTTGHSGTDHIRIMMMAEAAALFAMEVLAPGGGFICKFFQGGAEKQLLDQLKKHFAKIKHAKPAASRAESSETYLVAQGFRAAI